MSKLHEDYYLRKCCLKKNEVPSQSVVRRKMGSALAEVYFKSMSRNLKIIAGLEPPLKGGGNNWYMPPEELLKGRSVLKPLQRKFLNKFSCDGILFYGKKVLEKQCRLLDIEKNKMLLESDINWKKTIVEKKLQEWDAVSAKEQNKNTLKIKQAFHEFTVIYRTSLTKIETLLRDAAKIEIERLKQHTYDMMNKKFESLQELQRQQLFNEYEAKLEIEKNKYKDKFLKDVQNLRADLDSNMSAIKTEKYRALEKIRTILGYRNLACQVYVALKERTECEKEIETSKREHKNTLKLLSEQIEIKNDKISSTAEGVIKQNELNRLWQNKVCHLVRRFQEFVKYCLHTMPEQADFFINMEKLMLLQLSEALDDPRAVNIFEIDEEQIQNDAPKTHPFFLVCDEEIKPHIDPDFCPPSASSSQMSVIVVNKRCLYAACDNLKLLGDKLEQYLAGKDLNDGVIDDHDYDMDVPIHCTSSEQLLELKLESSLMQILQDEFLNIRYVETRCAVCGNQYCFCGSSQKESKVDLQVKKKSLEPAKKLDKAGVVKFAREPKIPSYLDYIRPDGCRCVMTAKKHLKENLPAYMTNVSAFEKVELPQYEICDVYELKKLIKEASNIPEKNDTQVEEKTKDVGTQYADHEFDVLCESFSDTEIQRLYNELRTLSEANDSPQVFECSTPMSLIEKEAPFPLEAEHTPKHKIIETPKLEEIFKSKCA